MEKCDICLIKIKKRNKNKHQQSKKHKYFLSNLIINKYIVRNDEIEKFKDILQSYYDEHKKKFNEFTVRIIWKKINMIINKITVPCTNTYQKTHPFRPFMFEIPIYVEVSSHEFLDIVNSNCVYNIITDEINIIFISNLKEMTLQHYIEQPRSMLCRKLERNYIEENYPKPDEMDFDYNFLPYCFRQIGFQLSTLLHVLLRSRE